MESNSSYNLFLQRHARRNFVANLSVMAFFQFGMSFVFGSTVLSLYASYLTESSVLIGLIPAMQPVAYSLPQLLLARQIQHFPRHKPFLVRLGIMERLPYLFVALSIFLWPNAPSWLAFSLLLLSFLVGNGSGGIMSPAWKSLLAKLIPVRRRGLMFGLSNALGGLLGILGGAMSSYVLERYAYPYSFGICFAMATMALMLSYAAMLMNREPARHSESEKVSAQEYWRKLPTVLRQNRNFTRYLFSRSIIILGTMAASFYILFAKDSFGVSDAVAGELTMAALIGQTISTPVLGWLADRRGHKWLTEVGSAISVLALAILLLSPTRLLMYPVFMLVNMGRSARMISGNSIVMEFSSPEELATYSALAGSVLALPVLVAPLLGGLLVDVLGYRPLFGVALFFALTGWASMHWSVREPRHEPVSAPCAGQAK